MGYFMNDTETEGSICAVSDPRLAKRLRREAKAVAVVKAIQPALPTIIGSVPYIPVEPARPDPTYTFWRHPNDTFPMGMIVYFMYSAGRVKIGFSNGLRGRHLQMKSSGPFPPVVVLVVKGTEESERQLHVRFTAERLHGEWFQLSSKLRSFLTYRLCPIGRASLQKAEAEFWDYCAEFMAGYRSPAKARPIPKQCTHGKPMHHPCYPCELARDLKILEGLK